MPALPDHLARLCIPLVLEEPLNLCAAFERESWVESYSTA
jgi:hypothetical protein